MTETKFCEALLFAGNRIDPPEYCDEEAEPDSEFCLAHAHAGDEYDPRFDDYDPDEDYA